MIEGKEAAGRDAENGWGDFSRLGIDTKLQGDQYEYHQDRTPRL